MLINIANVIDKPLLGSKGMCIKMFYSHGVQTMDILLLVMQHLYIAQNTIKINSPDSQCQCAQEEIVFKFVTSLNTGDLNTGPIEKFPL